MNELRAKIDYILKQNVMINKVFKLTASTAIKVLGLFTPIDDKAIIFSAHSRKYNDSPRAIYEYMINKTEFEDYTFYWALDDTSVGYSG